MKILLSTAGSGVYPQTATGAFPAVRDITRKSRRIQVHLLPAAVLPRQRRAPPPADADYDVLVYLALTVMFLLAVWR